MGQNDTDVSGTVHDIKGLMRQFVAERDWEKYHTPRNLAASVSIEAGELLEMFQWVTPEEANHKCMHDPAFRNAVGEEIADVLMYLVSLANAMNLDLTSTVHRKMEKNKKKYPVEQFKGRYEKPL